MRIATLVQTAPVALGRHANQARRLPLTWAITALCRSTTRATLAASRGSEITRPGMSWRGRPSSSTAQKVTYTVWIFEYDIS